MIAPKELRERIEAAMPGSQVTVDDLTGSRDHYRVVVVSAAFRGLASLGRHRMVYATVKEVLGGPLHALSLVTRTPEEP